MGVEQTGTSRGCPAVKQPKCPAVDGGTSAREVPSPRVHRSPPVLGRLPHLEHSMEHHQSRGHWLFFPDMDLRLDPGPAARLGCPLWRNPHDFSIVSCNIASLERNWAVLTSPALAFLSKCASAQPATVMCDEEPCWHEACNTFVLRKSMQPVFLWTAESSCVAL